MIELSIIIPVYNVENYVERCVLSCVNQDIELDKYEIILINDGSTDCSLSVLNRLNYKYHNIIIINKENGGVSSARNAGIEAAKGKYIWFVDADDYIQENSIKTILNIFENNDIDILQLNYCISNEKGEIQTHGLEIKETNRLSPFEYVNKLYFRGHVWESVFDRRLIDKSKYQFQTNIRIGEDELFFLTIFNYSIGVIRTKETFYYYFQRSDSALRTIKEEDYYNFLFELMHLKNRQNFLEYYEKNMNNWITTFILLSKKNANTIHKEIVALNMQPQPGIFALDRNRLILIFLYKYFGSVGINIYRRVLKSFIHYKELSN